MTSDRFASSITAESCLVARAKSDCSARTEGTLAGFGLKQLVTSTAPAFQERGKKAHADVVPTERLTLIDVLRYLVKLKRARWAVPNSTAPRIPVLTIGICPSISSCRFTRGTKL